MINADTLRHHRTLAGHSQRSLAKTAGLSPLGIKRIEDGADASRLPLAVVRRIAQAVDLTIDQLLAPPEPPSAPSEQPLPDPGMLTYQQARLLRRIQRGEDVRRSLPKTDRELTVPSMLRAGLVHMTSAGICCTEDVTTSLEHHGRAPSRPISKMPTIPESGRAAAAQLIGAQAAVRYARSTPHAMRSATLAVVIHTANLNLRNFV